MARTGADGPIYASPLLWGLILVATGAGVVSEGLLAGGWLFAGSLVGVVVLTIVERVVDRLWGAPERDNVIDPWDD